MTDDNDLFIDWVDLGSYIKDATCVLPKANINKNLNKHAFRFCH